ncbi:type I-E CRISPR-associated endoribonuclease Cas2 [Iodidimonas nitroreducens]|uniref:Type I-E CRISPR-associated endoribonuclease Cas2 n=1 Tax=Iodidimonas nitroreducens TaxID=1236968 RepID=A0A5A7NB48_9PROT|nr:type I-E CRISPR-associated endoribonuclease Cas2e [Iodidimonas nitroreducens]GAK34684.1 CRISPR-associated endoribonuclease Cas2 [alpha proteobacterium Q-1]GER05601.1 type I-E CRISPR-associated endoribonuclease Cas2 [Iodidimonas nitroreducens]
MPMTVIVTRDVEPRYRGFLASIMLEIAPGVYTSPNLSKAVRERILTVLCDWHGALGRGSIVLTWHDKAALSGQSVFTLGIPPKQIIDVDGLMLVKRDKSE